MNFYRCIGKKSSGGVSGSSFNSYSNPYNNTRLIDIDNDDRFEVTFSGEAWSYQSLFQYDEHNMYSAPRIADSQSTSAYLKNVSEETIIVMLVYKSSTEGSSYDYGSIINDSTGGSGGTRTIVTNIGGSVSGETRFITITPNGTLELKYQKDSSKTTGLDNVGILIYELEG